MCCQVANPFHGLGLSKDIVPFLARIDVFHCDAQAAICLSMGSCFTVESFEQVGDQVLLMVEIVHPLACFCQRPLARMLQRCLLSLLESSLACTDVPDTFINVSMLLRYNGLSRISSVMPLKKAAQ